eukprot:CAMPEP_0167767940 /NCGR_PEP_ID=MMETSP0110_2-20121227/16353_1 /TAXON_ID=629695 /ORGANISM="Gymnochlora sp., Strain CCMP2014" /LENGTH=157 /DNA_ID=CAMNT_0007656483 /DNA_START=145 /DNA_END=615 /DNA_ORIENTATION=+
MTRAVTKLVMEEPNEGSKASRKEALLGTDSKDPSTSILNPKFEATESKETAMAKREGKLGGKVAFLDISKTNGDVLLDRIEEKLQKAYPEIEVIRFKKPTFSRPCPQSIRKEIVEFVHVVHHARRAVIRTSWNLDRCPSLGHIQSSSCISRLTNRSF